MSISTTSRITLELEAGADPIRGVLEHPDGSRVPFWGWLELMDTLRRVAAEKPARASPRQARRAHPSPTREPSDTNRM
jgi:hypothetical protein